MRDVNSIISSLTFDREFLDKVKVVEKARRKTLHTNGVPSHYLFVFKTICLLKNEEMNMENISVVYRDVFGRSINGSSLSRTLLYLSNKHEGGVLGLVEYTDHPFADSRYKGVKLTASGHRLQQILIGSTTTNTSRYLTDKYARRAV
tara:strand:+ start:190 stop:630 length:441 start_codon:yes stop_codon:yes gene_type:complete